jgi:hypothetical protein
MYSKPVPGFSLAVALENLEMSEREPFILLS